MDRLILMTGGMDSYIIWRLEGRPQGLFFDFGHPSNQRELASLRKIEGHFGEPYFRIIEKEDLTPYEMSGGYMPYRNLLLFLWSSLEYPDAEILFGQVLEYLPDKNGHFYRMVERIARDLGRRKLRISVPYGRFTKSQMVAKFLAAGHPASELTGLTYSCMNSTHPPCGLCASCMSRWIAFTNNGIEEERQAQPTKSDWYGQHGARNSKFSPRNLWMYARRGLEAERAFRAAKAMSKQ